MDRFKTHEHNENVDYTEIYLTHVHADMHGFILTKVCR